MDRIVREEAAALPPEQQAQVASYLGQVPATVRRSLRRPSDPSGTTTAAGTVFHKPDDMALLLPAGLPRFKAGDRPLPGVDWELVELLGVGGFGEVWKARNPLFDGRPPVALKFCLDPAAKARLLTHEAKIISQVMQQGKHEGIVPLLHTYLSADPPCLEYEYVEGGDLAGVIQGRRGGLTAANAAHVVRRLAEIVGFAHRMSPPVVHRDLKPANILATPGPGGKWRLRITDFGIGGLAIQQAVAQLRRSSNRGEFLTAAVRGSYTPLYGSPQQMRGEDPDPRDDVYALGVIWHQLLTGDLTAGRPGGEAWKKRLAERGMTPALLALLASSFEDRREDRPDNAGDLCEKLGRALHDSTPASSSSQYPEAIPLPIAQPAELPPPKTASRTERHREPHGGRTPTVGIPKRVPSQSGNASQLRPDQTEAATRRKKRSLLMTFLMVVVVMAIIVVLAGIAVPITLSVLDSSKRDIARTQCYGLLSDAVNAYVLDEDVSGGNLPTSWDEVLKSPKASLKPEALVDPWGRQYHLAVPSSHNNSAGFDIWSDCGGNPPDVGNW